MGGKTGSVVGNAQRRAGHWGQDLPSPPVVLGMIPGLSHPVGSWGVEMGRALGGTSWTELPGRARSHQCWEVPGCGQKGPRCVTVWPGDARVWLGAVRRCHSMTRKHSDVARRCHGRERPRCNREVPWCGREGPWHIQEVPWHGQDPLDEVAVWDLRRSRTTGVAQRGPSLSRCQGRVLHPPSCPRSSAPPEAPREPRLWSPMPARVSWHFRAPLFSPAI